MHWLIERIVSFGDRPALADVSGVTTYAELGRLAAACIAEMDASSVEAGTVTGLPGDYSGTTVARLLACLDRRCIVVPLGTSGVAESGARMRVSGAALEYGSSLRTLPYSGEVSPMIRTLRERGHAGLILFSSGTSGDPKAMVQDFTVLADSYRDRRARALSLLLFLMFDHIGGLNTLFNGLASGATLVIPPDRSAESVSAMMARHAVAVLPASPTFLNLLLLSGCRSRHDFSALRMVTYGTEPMPEGLLARLRIAFPGVKFVQTFGTSETGISRTISKSSDSTWFKFDDPDLEWKIESGELWLRSATRAEGYLNASSERFTADGWFRTGDSVELSEDGYIRVLGRLSERINVGGEKVMPAEVESVLLDIPGVADALVHGEGSPITGNIVVARIVPEAGVGSDVLKREIRIRCREKLPPYKVPAKVIFTDALETGARWKKIRRS